MADYAIHIGGRNPYPAWRMAMTSEDTLYQVGTNTPEDAPALTGPTSPVATHMGNTGAGFLGAGWDVMRGYSSGTWVGSLGDYGSMIYGTGGHKIISNQLLRLNLSENTPTWSWWQDPIYVTSDTASADLYYSPSEQATLVAGVRGLAAQFDVDSGDGLSETAASVARWDGAFPVAFDGWIFPRKMTTGQMGNGVPHGYRYQNQAYLPASVTGGAPMYWMALSSQGPFSQNYSPQGVSDTAWCDASVLSGGSRVKFPYYVKNCTTGAWTEHQWQPDNLNNVTAFGGQRAGLFEDNKRLYVCSYQSGSPCFYYYDFTSGYAGHTVSAVTSGLAEFEKYTGGAFFVSDDGKHCCVSSRRGVGNEAHLTVYNFDAGTSFTVDLSASTLDIPRDTEFACFTWDSTNSRVLAIRMNPSTYAIEYWAITPPATMGASGWSCSAKRTLAYSTGGLAAQYEVANMYTEMYGKPQFIGALGVCIVTARQLPALAFIPTA